VVAAGRHPGPTTLDRANTRLRPAWTPELHHLLGSAIAETVIADPIWPSLIAAVAVGSVSAMSQVFGGLRRADRGAASAGGVTPRLVSRSVWLSGWSQSRRPASRARRLVQ